MHLKFLCLWLALCCPAVMSHRKVPEHFRFGIATASYQVEGAWNISDKAEQVWDHYTHTQPQKIKDRSNGDVACDSYRLYKRDVEMLRELGVDFYRFSISWSRLLPKGYGREVSKDGLRYYNDLIDELIKYNITPMVTLFHWDTPQNIQEIGGWTNPQIVDFFEDYVRVAFKHFGDRVKYWLTFNEAHNMCWIGYGTRRGLVTFAPDLNFHGFGEYLCTHNVLKAHAAAYRLYEREFKPRQQGRIGMANLVLWAEPESDSEEDKAIAEKALQFSTGWYLHPIYSNDGDYPPIMRQEIDRISKEQGFKHSRLPRFTPEEAKMLKGSCDFIGVNFYTSVVYKNDKERPTRDMPSYENDLGYMYYQPDSWSSTATSAWLKLRPDAFRDTLNWLKKTYGDNEIIITETGYSSSKNLNDPDRVDFLNTHVSAVLDAVDDGVNVTHFTLWSLMDNFEWSNGYTEAFGVYYVDFDSPNKTRIPRMSAFAYRELIKTKTIQPDYKPTVIELPEILPEDNYDLWIIFPVLVAIPLLLFVIIFVYNCFCKRRNMNKEQDISTLNIVNNKY